jgi:Terminase RNaseH-like domain
MCDEMLKQFPVHEREARSKGIPMLGSGKVYPVPEDDIFIDPIRIPEYWPKAYGMDVGWNRTAVVWGAWDRDSDIIYIYSEHYLGQNPPQIHAHSIRARGEHIIGVIDPAGAGSSQVDGSKLIDIYRNLGLKIRPANNAVEAGIFEVYSRLISGRLKVFRTCVNWASEYRIYRRSKKGMIVKENDHLMDATRYLISSAGPFYTTSPSIADEEDEDNVVPFRSGKSSITGY